MSLPTTDLSSCPRRVKQVHCATAALHHGTIALLRFFVLVGRQSGCLNVHVTRLVSQARVSFVTVSVLLLAPLMAAPSGLLARRAHTGAARGSGRHRLRGVAHEGRCLSLLVELRPRREAGAR